MLDAIYVALTGLQGFSRGLSEVANNTANLNTPGFKSVSVPLAELPPAPQLVLEAGRPQRSPVSSQERFGLKLRELKGHGVRVEGVEATSLSARAGLLPEDILTEVENRPVRTVADCLGALRSGLSRSTAGVLVQLDRQGLRTFVLLRAD